MVDDKKEELRAALKKQRERETKKEQKKKILIGAAIFILIASLVGVFVWSFSQTSDNQTQGEQLVPTKVDANGAFHVSKDGVLEDNAPTGNTRVDIFFDPMCPGCGLVDRGISDKTNELLNNGEIDLFMTPVAFLDNTSSDRYSTRAVNATITVAEESPEHYLAFVNDLYEVGHQPSEGSSYIPVSDEMLAQRAVDLGVPQEVADKFSNGHYTEWISENTNKQLNQREDLFPEGFSTPAVFLNIQYKDTETHSGEVEDFTRVTFDSPEVEETFVNAIESEKTEE